MALKWSWAFGPETALELETYTPWDPSNPAASVMAPTNTITHTYAGDASDRYSMQIRGNGFLQSPVIMSGSGWFSAYFYYNGSTNWDGYDLLQIWGPASGYSIDLLSKSTKYFDLLIAGAQVDTPSPPLTLADTTWHHLAVKYDMRTEDTWGAEVFVDGVSIMSASRTNSVLDAETTAYFSLGGVRNATVPTDCLVWSDIIIYDDLSDPNPYGNLVTRVEMDRDSSDSGSWTPASNTGTNAQSANLSGSISTTPVVSEADPSDGENIIISSSLTIAGHLGITPTSIYGVTGHLFASGSSSTNLFSAVAQGSTPTNFTSGTAQIDGENMYAWVTAPVPSLPSPNPWTAGSIIVLKAEVSGS